MKSPKAQKTEDYLILYTVCGNYLKNLEQGSLNTDFAPRYSDLENIKDIVEPFRKKNL